jgi:3-methyladenine DNA glycosylase AlkD
VRRQARRSRVIAKGTIAGLQRRLDLASDERSRVWWERYLKGAIRFRGVPMARIRAAVHAWWAEESLAELPVAARKDVAYALLREGMAEDKLAGIIVLQEILMPELRASDLPALAALFDDGWIADWNTCDWLCVKVLGNLIQRSDDRELMARKIAAWRRARSVWRRRASLVAFVNLAPRGDANFAGFTGLLLETSVALARGKERFAQTAVGWTLRELARADPRAVESFLRQHLDVLSRDAVRTASARMPKRTQAELLRLNLRAANSCK